jgi:hypothetical protein
MRDGGLIPQPRIITETPRQRRERITVAALQGLLAGSDPSFTSTWSKEDAAIHAVGFADALLIELDK